MHFIRRFPVLSKRLRCNQTITFKRSNLLPLPLLLTGMLLSSCGPTKPLICPSPIQITLPIERVPILREVESIKRGNEYCITERGRKDILINVELLRFWGNANMTTISTFNKLDKGDKK